MARPTGWDVVDQRRDPTPGEAHGVRMLRNGYRDLADEAASAARTLRSIKTSTQDSGVWYGRAAATFVEQIGDFPEMLDKCANSYRDVVGALDTWRTQLELHQSAADKSLANAKTAASDLAAGREDETAAKKSFTLADDALTEALQLLKKWEGKTPPDNVTLPTDYRISQLRSTRKARQAALSDATGDVSDAKARLASATRLVAEAKADYGTAAKQAATTIRAARAKAIPKDSIWKKITGSKAWQILVTVVTVVLVVAVVLALVLTGAGAAIALAVVAVAGAILTADDVAQFMAGNMSGAEFAIAMALNFIPGGKAGKAIVNGLKRVVAPLAKVAGALGDLKKVTGPVMEKLTKRLRKSGSKADEVVEKPLKNGPEKVNGTDGGLPRKDPGNPGAKGGDDAARGADDAAKGADDAAKGADDAAKGADDADKLNEVGAPIDDTFSRPRVMSDQEYKEFLGRRNDEIHDRLTTPDPAVQKMVDNFERQPWDPPMKDGRIAVPGSDKTISVEDYVRVRYASTWNGDSATTVLGRFREGDSMSYLELAEAQGARHFNLGEHWDQLKMELGDLTNEEMFEVFNKPFLKEALAKHASDKQSFLFSHKPNIDEYVPTSLGGEYKALRKEGFDFRGSSQTMTKAE